MNGSTKILTVSYGTFSCTLEGFDDPLGSMREIAEYFRDLASDDRYFGAEPPTPDVEMLQNIAEKEVRRRVEARVSDTGNVALVASDAPTEPEPDSGERKRPAAERQAVTSGPLTFDDEFLMADEPEDVLNVDPDAEADASGPAESVAEKLRRIRAVVSKSVEVEDEGAIRREQTPNADDPDKRDRALSETIRQIESELTDGADGNDEDARSAAELRSPEPEREPVVRHEEAVETREEQVETREEQVDTRPIAAREEQVDTRPVEEPRKEPVETRTVAAREEPVETRPVEVHEEAREAPAKVAEEVEVREAAVAEAREEPVAREDEPVAMREPEPSKDDEEPSHAFSPEPEEDDVGRLLDETDHKLNEDETVRRRRVISQMRAAVAATKADRLVTRQVSQEVEQEAEKAPYRADLSEVVEDEPAPEPQERPKSAPLVLVSSQRIDSVQPPAPASPQDFATFVASTGARELPELIEAAAAYTVFSEGQSSFTRPEIMKRVARVDPTLKLSREESLRSFGQLLRQGTFRKLERGQFTIDKATRFNPDQRAASR